MPKTPGQKASDLRYKKEHVKRVNIAFYPAEHELFDFLCTHDNKQGYIKKLILDDMERDA